MTEKEFREEMKVRIKAMNKVLTDDYLDGLSTKAILGLTHPAYREKWQSKYDKIMGVSNEKEC